MDIDPEPNIPPESGSNDSADVLFLCPEYSVGDLRQTYIKQNTAAKCHLYEFDQDFGIFDYFHIKTLLDDIDRDHRPDDSAKSPCTTGSKGSTPASVAGPSTSASRSSTVSREAPTSSDGSRHPARPGPSPPPRALKKVKYGIDHWNQISVGDDKGPGPLDTKSRRRKKSQAPKAEPRQRSSRFHQQAESDPRRVKYMKLLLKWLKLCDTFINQGFSIKKNASISRTRWQGVSFAKDDIAQLRIIWETPGAMGDIVKYFLPVYYVGKPSMLLDSEGRIFCYRTPQIPFLVSRQKEFHAAVTALTGPDKDNPHVISKFANQVRGPHFPLIMGHARQFQDSPKEGVWQRAARHESRFKAFMASEVIQRTTDYVQRTIEIMFPGVASRFRESAAWHKDKYQIEPMFGLFWNLCVNGLLHGQQRIHCAPHIDFKNIVGVCVLIVYQDPSIPFDYTKYSWLVLWEAGVAIQLPPWCMLIYPSSLLHHFNLDVHDFEFVMTDGARPTRENATPIIPGNKEGRGTFVYFNQATMYMSSETDSSTLDQAELAGKSREAHPDTVDAAFDPAYYEVFA